MFKKINDLEEDFVLGSEVAQIDKPVSVQEIIDRSKALELEYLRLFENYLSSKSEVNEVAFHDAWDSFVNYKYKTYISVYGGF